MVINEETAIKLQAIIDGGIAITIEDLIETARRSASIAMSEGEFLSDVAARARRRIAAGRKRLDEELAEAVRLPMG